MSDTKSKVTQEAANQVMDEAYMAVMTRLGPNGALIQMLLPKNAIIAIMAATLIEVSTIQKRLKELEDNG